MEFEFSTGFAETLGRNALQEVQLRRFQLLLDEVLDGNAFYRSAKPRRHPQLGRRPHHGRPEEDPVHHQAGTGYRPDLQPALRDQPHLRPHPLHGSTRRRAPRVSRCAASTPRTAGGGGPAAGHRCTAAPASHRWTASSSPSLRAVHRLLERLRGGPSHRRPRLPGEDVIAAAAQGDPGQRHLGAGVHPTYALHLAEVAAEEGIDIANSGCGWPSAGEPGAGIPATRARIEEAWGRVS